MNVFTLNTLCIKSYQINEILLLFFELYLL